MSQHALRTVLRIADAPPNASLMYDEVMRWPDDVRSALLDEGWLRDAGCRRQYTCTDCDEECTEEVHFVEAEGELPLRAFIVCSGGHGRIYIRPETLRHWVADLPMIAGTLSDLVGTGSEPREIVRGRLWWLGPLPVGDTHGDVFLARGTRWNDAAEVLGQSQVLRGSSLPVVLTLSETPTRGVFGEGTEVVPLHQVVSLVSGKPQLAMRTITNAMRRSQRRLHISPPKPSATTEAMLVIREASHQAHFRGKALSMTPRVLQVLTLLARQVVDGGGGWVRRDAIYDAVWSPSAEEPRVYLQQIDDTVKELRRALDAVEPGSGRRLVETKRRVGYRLSLSPPDIALLWLCSTQPPRR